MTKLNNRSIYKKFIIEGRKSTGENDYYSKTSSFIKLKLFQVKKQENEHQQKTSDKSFVNRLDPSTYIKEYKRRVGK